jgi:cysteine desulfurase
MYKTKVMKNSVYLDHNATTPLDVDLVKEISSSQGVLLNWGNPSSVYGLSRGPKSLLRETRRKLGEIFLAHPNDFIFNSGATEGNNTVFHSVWSAYGKTKPDYFISAVEHPSVLRTAEYLQSLGANIFIIPVGRDGQLDLNFLEKNISEKTALVSVMFANNETGTIFPIKTIIDIARKNNCLVHADCVQTLGKLKFNLKDFDLNYATFSAHKFYALKGTGVLYVKKGSPYTNLIYGGAQERFRRGGTENVIGIACLGFMLNKYDQLENKMNEVKKLRDYMESEILSTINLVSVTASGAERLGNTSSFLIDGVDGEILLMSLDLDGFAVSTGAACSSGSPEPSPVLIALGLSRDEAQNSLRVSLGWSSTQKEVQDFVQTLKICVDRIRDANQIPARAL